MNINAGKLPEAAGKNQMINLDDFKKLDIRIGKIVSARKAEGTEKLLRLEVDFGDALGKRQVVSGIAKFYDPETLIGKLCPFIINLEPRRFMGVESQGMIVAAAPEGKAVLLHPDQEVPEGTVIE